MSCNSKCLNKAGLGMYYRYTLLLRWACSMKFSKIVTHSTFVHIFIQYTDTYMMHVQLNFVMLC